MKQINIFFTFWLWEHNFDFSHMHAKWGKAKFPITQFFPAQADSLQPVHFFVQLQHSAVSPLNS